MQCKTTSLELSNVVKVISVFEVSNILMARWCSQTLPFDSVTDKNKHRTFSSPSAARSLTPTKLGTVIEVRTVFAILKCFAARRC